MEELKKAVISTDNETLLKHFETIYKGLSDANQIVNADFEDYIFRPIVREKAIADGFKRRRHGYKIERRKISGALS